MGSFTTEGITMELERFRKLSDGTQEACEAAVNAGGKVLVQRLKEAAPVHTGGRKGVKPGALRDSIKAGKVAYNAADGFYSDVGPTGKDHGEPLAKIGNILEYGRSNMDARPWFEPTKERSAEEVRTAMQKAFDDAQGAGAGDNS